MCIRDRKWKVPSCNGKTKHTNSNVQESFGSRSLLQDWRSCPKARWKQKSAAGTTRYDSILWWASACLSLQPDNGLTTCKALKDKRALARMRSLVFSGWSWNNTQSYWNFLVGRVDHKKYWWLRNRWLCKAVIISNTYEEQASPAVLARPHDALRSRCLGAFKELSRRNFRNHPPD